MLSIGIWINGVVAMELIRRFCAVVCVAVVLLECAGATGYRWSARAEGLVSTENGCVPEGFLWIDEECDSLKALMFAFQNMNEETLFSSPRFRRQMAAEGVGLLWIAPGFGQEWDVTQGVQDVFNGLLDSLAVVSGHTEVAEVPLIAFGHSAQATMPWNFAAWNQRRTLCVVSYHGDAPRTNLCGYGRSNVEWGRTRNIDGIPGLMVMGEYEWWDARLRPALAFRMMYPGSCVSFLGDAGRGHFDLSERTADYIALFIKKSIGARLRDGALVAVNPDSGWLAQSWHPAQTDRAVPAPRNEYKGCPYEAFWYFDDEMASLAEERYRETAGKRLRWIGFERDGRLLNYDRNAHCKVTDRVRPDSCGRFVVKAVFTDSTRTVLDQRHSTGSLKVRYVSGPARAVNDSVFEIDIDHPTWRNPRRKGRVTLCAEAPADGDWKETVQEIEITIDN